MNDLALFSETPRAGKLGHRFLLPPHLAATESEIAAYLRVVSSDVVIGQNFMAMGRSVPQHNGTGVVRLGREIIVIAGVDVQRLSEQRVAEFRSLLQKHLCSLEDLVLAGIDWNQLGQAGVIIRRQEMETWLDEYQALSPVVTPWRGGPRLQEVASTLVSPPGASAGHQTRSYAKLLLAFSSLALSFVLGIFARPYLTSVMYPGKGPGQPPKSLVRTEITTSSSSSGGNDGVPCITKPAEPKSEVQLVAVDLSALLQNVMKQNKADTLAEILASWPPENRLSKADYDQVIIFCSRLMESDSHDNCLNSLSRIATRIGDSRNLTLLDPAVFAAVKPAIDDLQIKLEEKYAEIDSEDQRLYGEILQLSGKEKEQIAAAKNYLEQAPRTTMKSFVDPWLEWAESPIIAKVSMDNLPGKEPFTVRFAANDRAVEKRVPLKGNRAKSPPLDMDLTGLEITRQKPSATVTITVTLNTDPVSGSGESREGIFHLGTQSAGRIPVDWKPVGILSQFFSSCPLSLSVELPGIDTVPKLPEWRLEPKP